MTRLEYLPRATVGTLAICMHPAQWVIYVVTLRGARPTRGGCFVVLDWRVDNDLSLAAAEQRYSLDLSLASYFTATYM